MLFGNAWTKLRIGMLFAITDAPGGIASANLALGVCSGPVGFGSASTTHAVVYTPNNATTGTNYTYNAGAGYPYYNQGVVSHFTERVNGSNTSVITTAGQPCLYSLGGTLRMGLLGVDFAKIGGNVWTISLYFMDAAKPYYHCDGQSLMEMMEQPFNAIPRVTARRLDTGAFVQATLIGGAGGNNLTGIDEEATGSLDSVNIFWNTVAAPVQVYALAVSRHGWV
jgi:hypothetical protein